MRERILVIGATGLVGNALLRAVSQRKADIAGATSHREPGKGFEPLDITDARAVEKLLQRTRPGVVALPAANAHVDYCERHPEETRRVNVAGAYHVLGACRGVGARLVYFSSDYVFDGGQELYGEDDVRRPLNEYGRQKAEIEAAVLAADSRNLVIRTAGVFGWQRRPKNFVLQVISELSRGRSMKVACDVKYNPTYAENLAEITADLCERGCAGIFNVVGSDNVGRYEFARQAAEAFGLDVALLAPVPASAFNAPARRPKESGLRTDKVRAAAPTPLWGARQGLAHMVSFKAEWTEYAEKHLPSPPARVG